MESIIKRSILLTLLVLILGCEMPLPEMNSEEAVLYKEKCGLCHPPYNPGIISLRAWERIIPAMEKRVKATGIRKPLTEDEKTIILGYLKKHSRERRF